MFNQIHPVASLRLVLTVFLGVLAALVVVQATAEEAEATHFRAGTLSATQISGTQVRIEGTLVFRHSYEQFSPRNPGVGQVIEVQGDSLTIPGTSFNRVLYLRVEAVDTTADILTGRIVASSGAPVVATVPTANNNGSPWKVVYFDCCRILQQTPLWHINNPNTYYRLEARFTLNAAFVNTPARTLLPPVVSCVRPVCSFRIPTTDAEGHSTFVMLAPPGDMGSATVIGGKPPTQQPAAGGLAASVDGATGMYTWNASAAPVDYSKGHNLYSTQVHVFSPNYMTPVDFFIELVDSASVLPSFPGPNACGSQLTFIVDEQRSVSIQAQSATATTRSVTLGHMGLPAGASFVAQPPAGLVSGSFSWRPSPSQVGTYLVVFTAVDTSQYWAPFCVIEIVVQPSNAPNAQWSHEGTPIAGTPVSFSDASWDSDGQIVARQWNFGDGTVISTTSTTVSHVYNATGEYLVQLLVTDNTGLTGRLQKPVVIGPNQPPTAQLHTLTPFVRPGIVASFYDAGHDPEGRPVQRTFEFGDGTSFTTGLTDVDHAYASEGRFQVNVTVYDGWNAPVVSTAFVVVDGTPPVVDMTVTCSGEAGWCAEPAAYSMSASDPNLDHVECRPAADAGPCHGTFNVIGRHVFEVVARDLAGNEARFSRPVWLDLDAPVVSITPGVDVWLEAEGPEGAHHAWTYEATDPGSEASGLASQACSFPFGIPFPIGSTVVECTATDVAGHSARATFSVRVEDTTPPAWPPFDPIVLELDRPHGMPVFYDEPQAYDLVDGPMPSACHMPSGSTFTLGETLFVCESVADSAGNRPPRLVVSVTLTDTTPPRIAPMSDLVFEATDPMGAHVDYTPPLAEDAVSGVWEAGCDPTRDRRFPVGETIVTCEARDGVGLSADPVTFRVLVQDTIAPTLDSVSDLTFEATSSNGAWVLFAIPGARDAVSGEWDASCDPTPQRLFRFGTTVVTCTAVDGAGNAASVEFKVHVVDTTPPEIAPSPNLVVEATGAHGAEVTFPAPETMDAVDNGGFATCAPASHATFPLGLTVVTCRATDSAGNAATSSFEVLVEDTTPPSIPALADVSVEATSASGAVVAFDQPGTWDAVDGPAVAHCLPAPGATFALGETIVTCTAEDAAGNVAQRAFHVRVRDTTAPSIAPTPGIVAEATGPEGAPVTFEFPATNDAVDGAGVATCDVDPGSTFPLGSTWVSCVATDAAGNAATASFEVVVRDTTAPSFVVPADLRIEATSASGAVAAYDLPWTWDAVDGAGVASCDPPSGTTFVLGSTSVTCAAIDAAGNTAVAAFVVTVVDTTPPAIESHPDVVVEATGSSGAIVTFVEPATSDAVDGDGVALCDPPSGTAFPVGITTVVCRATDAAGNLAESTFVVEVLDGAGPIVTTPRNVMVVTASSVGRHVTYPEATATDAVDGDVPVTCSPESGDLFPVGVTTVVCRATDAAGNVGEGTFTVQVHYDWTGFLAPLTKGKAFNQGSTVPFKFRLANESAAANGIRAHLFVAKVVNGVAGTESPAPGDGAKVAGAPAHRFRFVDPTSTDPASYHLNVDTKKLAPGTWRFRADLGDGVLRTIDVVLK